MRENKLKSNKITDEVLNNLFKNNGSIFKREILNKEGEVKIVYEISIYYKSKRHHLPSVYTLDEAEESIINFYKDILHSEIKCKVLVITVNNNKNNNQYLLTEDGRVFNKKLKQLTENKGKIQFPSTTYTVNTLLKEFEKFE